MSYQDIYSVHYFLLSKELVVQKKPNLYTFFSE